MAFPTRLTVEVGPFVHISIFEVLYTFSMLVEAIKRTLISRLRCLGISVSVDCSESPLPAVDYLVCHHKAYSMLETINVGTFVSVVLVKLCTTPVLFVVREFPEVPGAICLYI